MESMIVILLVFMLAFIYHAWQIDLTLVGIRETLKRIADALENQEEHKL